MATKPTVACGDGLLYSDDDKYLSNVDEDEYEENNFSSFPQNDDVNRNYCILGRPQQLDTSKMTLREEELALDKYQKKRKEYTDANQLEMVKQLADANINTLLQRSQMISYSGDQTPLIRLMMVVEAHPLVAGQTFQHKANMTMAALGFAILFGNKDKNNWTKFCKFIKNTQPIVNLNNKTIITNQDKGSIALIKDIIPEAALFHCSFHCRQNIIKKYGGGEGHVPLSCLWMYQLLVKCNSPGSIQFLRLKYEHQMSPAYVNYLNSISDKQQFPMVRCAMAETVCMYRKTVSSGVEAMNRANDSIQR